MAALGLLNGVHGEKPDAVGHITQVLVTGLGNRLDGRSGRDVSHDWRLLLREIDQGETVLQVSSAPNRMLHCDVTDRQLSTFFPKPACPLLATACYRKTPRICPSRDCCRWRS